MLRTHILRLTVLTLLVATPSAAHAAANNFLELSKYLVFMLNAASTTAIVCAIAVYFYAIAIDFKDLMSGEGGAKRVTLLFWGVVGLFVMVSIWGILRLLENTFLGG